jgi:8-oxo-dGTP pyrophosphatase MutT (NUDIX family)
MQLNTEHPHDTLQHAATVVLLRQGPHGPEVLLLQRHSRSKVLGGAYVFPGGKLDALDMADNTALHLDQPAAQLHAQLAEAHTAPAMAAALYVTAIRETLEESGIFLAHHATTAHSQHALQLLQQGHSFNQVLAQTSAQLNTAALLPWSRWITPLLPSVGNKRFDTRFFIAALPPNQTAQHDNHEAVASIWLTPAAALERYWANTLELAPPQIMSLAHLARWPDVQSALHQAQRTPPAMVFPETYAQADTRIICYPGDPQHSIATRALPGPTRLVYRNQRFEPEGGFQAFFD